MRVATRRAAPLSAALAFLSPIQAQPPAAGTAGARVRVTAPAALTPPRQEALLLAVHGDSVMLRVPGRDTPVALAREQVVELQVARAPRRLQETGKGMLAGLLAGAVFGAALLALTYRPPVSGPPWQLFAAPMGSTRGDAVAAGAMVVGMLGMVIGGLVGTASAAERWEPIPVLSSNVRSAESGLPAHVRHRTGRADLAD